MLVRLTAGTFLVLHGVVHLFGFIVPWQLAQPEGFSYHTTALNGVVELGDAGARLLGLAWLALMIGFVIAGIGLALGRTWAIALTAVVAAISLLVCVVGLPEAVAGVWVNAAILVAVGIHAVMLRRQGAATARPGPS